MDTKLKKLTETEKRILLWMLTDLSMVLILCGKLLRKWASEFEWGMWRNIEWGIGIGVTVVGVLGIAAALYLVWKFRKNTGNSKMTAFAGSEPEKAGKTAKSSEGAAADKSETDEIEKSRQMQFEARAAAEAEKEQLFLKKSEKVPNELLVLVGGFAFFRWLQPLRHSYARYRIVAEWGTVIECVQTGLLFFGICGVFLLSAGILVCRYEKKQLREMSFFCRERKRYRDRTSLERQLAGQSKWPFRVALIAELLIVITITGLINGMDGEVLFVILLGLTTLILILFAWKTYRSRLNREMGLLMEQIHTMAEGSMESRIHEISEKSLLLDRGLINGWAMVNAIEGELLFASGMRLSLADATEVYVLPPAFATPGAAVTMPLRRDELTGYDCVWVEPISMDAALRDELRGWYHIKRRFAENEVGQRFYFDFYGAKWLAFPNGPGNI